MSCGLFIDNIDRKNIDYHIEFEKYIMARFDRKTTLLQPSKIRNDLYSNFKLPMELEPAASKQLLDLFPLITRSPAHLSD